jgi:hypothetical protein
MTEDPRLELERLMRELSDFDEAERNSPPTDADPEGAERAMNEKAARLARIRILQDQLRGRGT